MIYYKECIVCGEDYKTLSNRSKCCSDKCKHERERENNRSYKGIIIINKICCMCNNNFKTYKNRQNFCSKKCRREFYNNKIKKENEGKEKINSLGLRYSVLVRDKFTCQYCGRTPQQGIILHVDHIKPKSIGGKDVKDNLISACEECNFGKSDKHYGEILIYLKNKNFDVKL